MKTLKKYVAMLAMASLVLGPVQALAETVTTGLQQDGGSTQTSAPVVIAKWEMDGPVASLTGTDAETTAKSQMAASGQCGVHKTMRICGIVADPNGKEDIKNAYGDVYYPNAVRLGNSHVDPITGNLREVQQCGEMVRECTMTKLTPANAFDLFCNKIRNNNNNLPEWAANYNYANVCDTANEGVLAKETAYVYCCDFTLSYEDPNGAYTVKVWANDQSDYNSVPLENTMTYLATTAFDIDFTGIDYGKVKTGVWQEVPGNTTWATTAGTNGASVKNCGNTRLQMGVMQDDMGIKDPDGTSYVQYKAAVSSATNYQTYLPGATKWLNATLDLSEMNEMDFGVNVSKFPIQLPGPFSGTMELSGKSSAHIVCSLQ
jgi:hypothetical protein